jgi:hypothetical protein
MPVAIFGALFGALMFVLLFFTLTTIFTAKSSYDLSIKSEQAFH